MNVSWRVSVCPSGTGLGNEHFWKMYIVVWWMSGVVDVWCGGCPVWWMSGVVDVLFYTRCGGCLVWWMSGVVDVCVVDVVQSMISTTQEETIFLFSCPRQLNW